LAQWIRESEPLEDGNPGDWGIVAPTFGGDARAKCIEGPSGLLKALGPDVRSYNRSEGVVTCWNGCNVICDGADDGANRIQGWNLRGLWADEVGLWVRWDQAWNFSIQPAVRLKPGKIVATGTPKMAHGLIAQLLRDPKVVETHMRTIDNVDNLDEPTVAQLYAEYGGSTLGRQELEGEFIEALEGEILRREHWQWFDPDGSYWALGETNVSLLPRLERIVHSWDTALKGKTSSDYVAGQTWGLVGPDRFLLRLWHGHAGLEATVTAMGELRGWAGELWPDVPQWVLIENTANGPEAITKMRTSIDGVVAVRADGDKVRRAMTASPALETGHCYLPGRKDAREGSRGYSSDTPAEVQALVEECAMFRGDLKHLYDDQVDAWSQMVNWTRLPQKTRASMGRPQGRLPRPGSLAGTRGVL
jgi:phage terminase large subunit-like protein